VKEKKGDYMDSEQTRDILGVDVEIDQTAETDESEQTDQEKNRLGREMVELIRNMHPARLKDAGDSIDDESKEKPSMNDKLNDFITHSFENGEQGKRFQSDYWQNNPGWGVAIPEIIKDGDTLYLACRWWNWIGGFSSQMRVTEAEVNDSQYGVMKGYTLYKRGVGYAPASQFFITDTGEIYEFKRKVISHDPVRYQPVGGDNVGWTETQIQQDLNAVDQSEEDSDLTEMVRIMKDSTKRQNDDGLREIMKTHFVME
jgi:hypothetical protein